MLRHHATGQPAPSALLQQLVAYNSISNRGVYKWHQHVLAALTDSRLAMAAAAEASAGDGAASTLTTCWDSLREVTTHYNPLSGPDVVGADEGTPVLSTAMLQHLQAMAVLQPGDMYAYVCADLVAAALWRKYLQDPLDPAAWQVLRTGLFESDARAGTVSIFEGLLGPGSMQELTVGLHQGDDAGESGGGNMPGSTRTVTGWVLNLGHPSFEEIDLWG